MLLWMYERGPVGVLFEFLLLSFLQLRFTQAPEWFGSCFCSFVVTVSIRKREYV